MRRAAVIGAGSWGTAVAVLLARGGLEVQLGTRTAEQAAEIDRRARERRYLPGVAAARRAHGQARRPRSSSPASTWSASRSPRRRCRRRSARSPTGSARRSVGPAADQGPGRAAGPAAGRVRRRAGPRPGDRLPRRPRPRPRGGLRLGRARARLATTPTCATSSARSSTAPASSASAPTTSTGVEMAGAAKNAAALAAAAAEPHGLNAAGIAAAEIWRECVDYAIARGAELETFSGLAGVGDLTATVLAPGSRNRRAGELLGTGVPADADPGPDRPGLRGPRLGAAAGRGGRARRDRGRGPRRPRGADRGRDRRRASGSPACAGPRATQGGRRGRIERTGSTLDRCVGTRRSRSSTATLEPGREGRARPRLRGPLPGPPARRLLLRLLPDRQPPRRRGPDRAGLPAGLPALRPGAARVRRPAAAAVADPDRPQPRLQLLPRPLAPAADAARQRRADPAHPHGTERSSEGREELRQVMRQARPPVRTTAARR